MPQEGRSPPTTMPGDHAPGRAASPPRGSDSAPQKLTKAGEATPKRPSTHENRPRTVHGPPTVPAPGIAPALHIKVPVGILGAGAARLGAGAAPHVRLARSPDDRVRASSPSCSPAGSARTWALIEARGRMPAPRLRRHSWTRSPAAAWIASPGLPCGSSASRAGVDAAATHAAEFFRRSRPRGRRLSAGAFWSGMPGTGARADESASRRPTTRIRPGRAAPQDQRQGHPPLGPPAGYGLLPRLDRDAVHVLVPAGHVPSGGRDAECDHVIAADVRGGPVLAFDERADVDPAGVVPDRRAQRLVASTWIPRALLRSTARERGGPVGERPWSSGRGTSTRPPRGSRRAGRISGGGSATRRRSSGAHRGPDHGRGREEARCCCPPPGDADRGRREQ